MYRSSSTRIVPIIIFVVVAAALIIGLVSVGRYLFGGGGTDEQQITVEQAREQLLTVEVNRSVRMLVRGPIVADESFRTFEITVTPTERRYVEYTGYRESVDSQKDFSNNNRAYEQFVFALDKAAFTSPGRFTEAEASDVRGICATGRVYEFELLSASQQLQRYWTSTCKGSPGTLGASLTQIVDLFSAQIPDTKLEFRSSAPRLSL